MRDVNGRRKGSLGLGGPRDKPTILLVDIHNLIYINPNYDYENMQDSL